MVQLVAPGLEVFLRLQRRVTLTKEPKTPGIETPPPPQQDQTRRGVPFSLTRKNLSLPLCYPLPHEW
ncbi:unnamed protein product [Boreogadus saida]